MKTLNTWLLLSILFLGILQLCSCTGSFSAEELKFVSPYHSDSTVAVYRSKKGDSDTITFYKYKQDTIKYRSFEQGFDNIIKMYEIYQLSPNSYHKILGPHSVRNWNTFIYFEESKEICLSKEARFMGMIFDEGFLNKVLSVNDTTIVFSKSNAQYKQVNANKPINSFVYSTKEGVISFTDEFDDEWTR